MADISKEDAAIMAAGAASGGGIAHGITSKLRKREAGLWELDRVAKEKAAVQKALQAQFDEALHGNGSYSAIEARRDRKAAFARIEQESADRLASLSENFDWVGNPREAAPGAPSPAPEAPKAGRGAPAAAAPKAPSSPQLKIVGDRVWLDGGGRKIVAVQYGDEPPRIFMSSSGTSQAVGQSGHVGKGNWFETKGIGYDGRQGGPVYGKAVLGKTPIPGSSGEAIADELNYGRYGQGLEPTHHLNINSLDETVDFNDWVKATTGTNEPFAVGKKGQVMTPIDRAQADAIRQNGWRWPAAEAAKTPTKDPQWKGASAEALVEETPLTTPEMVPAERVPPAEYKARESQRRAQELKRAAREKLGFPPEGPLSSPLEDSRSSFGAVPERSSPELGRISPRDHMPRDLRAALGADPSAPQDYRTPFTEESIPKEIRPKEDPSFHQRTTERQALNRSGALNEPSFGFRATPESAPVVSKTPAPIDHQRGVSAREVVMNPRGKVPAPPERMTIPSQSTPAPIVLGEAPSGAPPKAPSVPTEAPTTGLRGVPGRLEDAPDYGYSAGPSTPKPKKALKGAGAMAWKGVKTAGKIAGGAALGYEGGRAIGNLGRAMKDDGAAQGVVTGGAKTVGDIVGETGGLVESIGNLGQRAGEGLPPEMQQMSSASLPLELGGRAISAAGRGIQKAGRGIKKGGRWWIGERAPLEAGKEIAEMQARGEFEGLDDIDLGLEDEPEEFPPTPLRKSRDDAAKDAFRMSQAPQPATAL